MLLETLSNSVPPFILCIQFPFYIFQTAELTEVIRESKSESHSKYIILPVIFAQRHRLTVETVPAFWTHRMYDQSYGKCAWKAGKNKPDNKL